MYILCPPLILLLYPIHLFRAVTMTDYPSLEKVAESAIKDRQKFERLVVPKETLLEMFHVCLFLNSSVNILT